MSFKHRLAAYQELLRHYRDVFLHAWKERESLGGSLFNEKEAEFLPAALSLQERPVSSSARLTGWLLTALAGTLLVWSILGKIDIVVNATGKIIPSEHTKTLASVDVAAVRAIHVREGQEVKAGDVLLELDTKSIDAERDKAAGDAMEATLLYARSRAFIQAIDGSRPPRLPPMEGVPRLKWQEEQKHLDGQYRDFKAKLDRVEEEIRRYEEELPLVSRRAADYGELAKNRDVSPHSWLEKEQARIDLEGQLRDAKGQRAALIAETRRAALDAMEEGGKAAAESRQDALRADFRGRLLKLSSPVDGTVQQLSVHTVGGVVQAAQPLMLVVPRENVVEVEAYLDNKDVGFVSVGQLAEVKIDAFDYTRYGTVQGKVIHVSRDAIQDEKKGLVYSVKVALDQSAITVENKKANLSAGMSVEVEIKTGTRRVIEYFLSPLIQHGKESFHER